MPWKSISTQELAEQLGIDFEGVKRKHRIIDLIVAERKKRRLSQRALAKKLGVSQARIAQIESGVGTKRVTYEALFQILDSLNLSHNITVSGRRVGSGRKNTSWKTKNEHRTDDAA